MSKVKTLKKLWGYFADAPKTIKKLNKPKIDESLYDFIPKSEQASVKKFMLDNPNAAKLLDKINPEQIDDLIRKNKDKMNPETVKMYRKVSSAKNSSRATSQRKSNRQKLLNEAEYKANTVKKMQDTGGVQRYQKDPEVIDSEEKTVKDLKSRSNTGQSN